ncbi:MAG: gamma-glutamyltransferase [Ignavibacteriaceae bacterium]
MQTYFRSNLLSVLFALLLTILFNYSAISQPVRCHHGMVVSASQLASKIGVEIMKKGGNAVDAAVAVGFALAVTYPYAGNIGGGGFMVIHLNNGLNTTIDFREKAPFKSSKDMYLDENGNYIPSSSKEGALSAGVPGNVAGLIYALNKYGSMKLHDVIQPAIDLAKNGWELDYQTAEMFDKYLPEFEKYPSSFRKFSKYGDAYRESDLFKQPDLAWTLEQIEKNGRDGFYKGRVAALILNQVQSMGGIISREDLEKYQPVERKPIMGNYRGYKVISMPPPSSGGIALVELLNIIENYKLNANDWGSSEYIHHLVEAMKYVFADRTYMLGEKDFFHVPEAGLISKEYAKTIFQKIQSDSNKAVPSDLITSGNPSIYSEGTETTHYSVYDEFGNSVSTTTTINSAFGSKIVIEGAGFLLNNEMDDFSVKPGVPNQFGLLGTEANSIEPGKRMLSSMTPTLVLKNDKPYIIIGSPGGSTIITTVLQVIINCIDFHMNIQEAIDMPRIHHQWKPDEIYFEKFAINTDAKDNLIKMGYKFADMQSRFTVLGVAEGIMIDNLNHIIFGASDPRGSGSAEGF